MKAEIDRRTERVAALYAFFAARPGVWIHWEAIAAVAGACAWRTRLSDLRLKRGMVIEWNKSVKASAYRWLPPAVVEVRREFAAIEQRLF